MAEQAQQVSLDELEAQCLRHYKKLADKAHYWHNQVPQAIKFWYAHKRALEQTNQPHSEPQEYGSSTVEQSLYKGQVAGSTPARTTPTAAAQIDGASALTESGWTVEAALRFYSDGKHFDVVEGRTRIIDTGAVASDALKGLSPSYAAMKGVECTPSKADGDLDALLEKVSNLEAENERLRAEPESPPLL